MQSLSIFDFVILVLAAFRLTRLVVYDDITNFIRRPFTVYRQQSTLFSCLRFWLGGLLNCYWCFSFWASVGVYLVFLKLPVLYPLLVILAIAGASAILQSFAKWLNPQEYL